LGLLKFILNKILPIFVDICIYSFLLCAHVCIIRLNEIWWLFLKAEDFSIYKVIVSFWSSFQGFIIVKLYQLFIQLNHFLFNLGLVNRFEPLKDTFRNKTFNFQLIFMKTSVEIINKVFEFQVIIFKINKRCFMLITLFSILTLNKATLCAYRDLIFTSSCLLYLSYIKRIVAIDTFSWKILLCLLILINLSYLAIVLKKWRARISNYLSTTALRA
jgi:hypothetical protein